METRDSEGKLESEQYNKLSKYEQKKIVSQILCILSFVIMVR